MASWHLRPSTVEVQKNLAEIYGAAQLSARHHTDHPTHESVGPVGHHHHSRRSLGGHQSTLILRHKYTMKYHELL